MNQSLIFLFAAIIIVGAIMCALICFRKKSGRLDVEHYRAKCLTVEHQLKKDNPSSYHLAVLNADKLVDQVLKDLGIKGQTMGERMKNHAAAFSDRNGIWEAHKLRNVVAHEPDAHVTYEQAKRALANFRKALKDLGAI